jgi:hypothetical protein
MFSFLRTAVTIPAATSVVSALAFVTANPPTAEEPGKLPSTRPPKILSAYKLWVGGALLGTGPGRGRCPPGVVCTSGHSGGTTEMVFDGYDATSAVSSAIERTPSSFEVFASGFGLDQSAAGAFASGGPKVLFEMHLELSDNTSMIVTSHPSTWDAHDADPVYNPRGSSGCAWYYYPQENFNASRLPAGTPLAALSAHSAPPPVQPPRSPQWQAAVAQPAFSSVLVPKPVAPIAITEHPASSINVTQISPNRFFVDLGRELQGGLRLELTGKAAMVRVTVAEELLDYNTSRTTVMYPPRTSIHPQMMWALDGASAASASAEHHEYLEFRFAELQFDGGGGDSGCRCGSHIREEHTASISCGASSITGFSFASFGTSSGGCDCTGGRTGTALAVNASCHSNATEAVLHRLCVGKSSCEVPVNTTTFGEPCHKTSKWLSFNATCSGPSPAPISRDDFNVSAWVVHLPYAEDHAAQMSSSSSELDAVFELCRYTLESSSLDLYSDSNARQRSVDCSADDVTALQGQYATSNELALQKYAIQQLLANGQAGRIDWSLLPVIAVYHHIMHTGDLSIAIEHFEELRALLELTAIGKTGLSENTTALVDWPPGMQDGWVSNSVNTIASAWTYYGLDHLERIARMVGREADAQQLRSTGAKLKAAMNLKQWNETAGAFCDGICAETPHMAFHSTVYTLAFGAASDANALRAWQYVRHRIDPPLNHTQPPNQAPTATHQTPTSWPPPGPSSGLGMPCSVMPAQFALAALYDRFEDRGVGALKVLTSDAKHSWVAMLKKGATMTMEAWSEDEKPNLTWSHPWAASPSFIIAWYLFGIRPASPAFASVAIRPQVGDLKSGKLTMPTVKGPVTVSFTNSGTAFVLQVVLPVSSSGRVSVPLPPRTVAALAASQSGGSVAFVLDGRTTHADRQDVDRGYLTVTVGSGSHRIVADDALLDS